MFCGECGAKNKKTDSFCCECGSPLANENEEKQEEISTKKTSEPKKPMTKKNKIIVGLIVLAVIVLGIGYKIGSDLTGPKKIAEGYIKAYVENDGGKLYKYLDLSDDKTFVTKKIFTDLVKESAKDSKEIMNYKITGIEYGSNKLTAKVKFNYTVKGSSSESTNYVNLVKEKGKKLLLFDNWKITNMSESSITVKNYTIKAPKGSKITYVGVKLTDKYLDKKQSSETQDVYVLPKVFNIAKADIKTTLPNGLELEEKVKPYSYSGVHTVNFDKNSMSTKMKDDIVSKAKDSMTTIYNGVIQNKTFADIKAPFEKEGIDLTTLNNTYDNLKNNLSSSTNKLTSITFTDGSIYDVTLKNDGNIKVRVKLNYKYSIEYEWYNEKKKYDGTNYRIVTVNLKYDNGQYYLVDCDDLITYFYRY